MKSLLISIKPKWCAKIMNGEKTIVIRKTMPKCDLPIDVYIYCTKDKEMAKMCKYSCDKETKAFLNLGKVVAKFTLNKVDKYVNGCNVAKKYPTFNDFEKILTPACLYTDELENYCDDLSFYAWHISNLVIFDKPKELNEFNKYTDKKIEWYSDLPKVRVMRSLTKAPQNMCYIETDN